MAEKSKDRAEAPRRRSWADLPEGILAILAERLDSRIDFLRFCATCSSWRSLAMSLPGRTFDGTLQVPELFFSRKNQIIKKGFYSVENFNMYRVYLVRQTRDVPKRWLAWVAEKPGAQNMRVELLSKTVLGCRRRTIPDEVNILDVSMSELYKYYFMLGGGGGGGVTEYGRSDEHHVYVGVMGKIAVMRSRSVAGDYAVMGLCGNNGRLAFLKSSKEGIWTPINNYEAGYNDVIDYNGKFYAVHYTGKLLVIDLSSNITEIASPVADGTGGIQKILVESAGDLLLLDKYIDLSDMNKIEAKILETCFKVYKLNEEQKTHKLVEMWSLGDRSLFLTSRWCSFSVSTQHLTGCTPNCIYLKEQCDNAYQISSNSSWKLKTDCPAVFNLGDGTYKRMKPIHD